MFSKTLLALTLICLPQSIATPHEEIYTLPTGWRHVGCPPDDDTLRLQVSLKQQNLSRLDTLLRRISDPDSSCYGKYLDRDEVDALFKPSDHTTREVQAWLAGAGISRRDIHVDNHYLSFSTSVRNANELLNTTFLTYTNDEVHRVRAMNYFIPESVKEHIHFVSPTTYFGGIPNHKDSERLSSRSMPSKNEPSPRSEPTAIESCQTFWTPSCLRNIYNINGYEANSSSGSKIAWGAFFNMTASYTDLEAYEELYAIPSRNFTVEVIQGGLTPQEPSAMSEHLEDLDAFTYTSLTNGQLPLIQYSVGGLAPGYIPNADGPLPEDNGNEPYLALYTQMLGKTNAELPQVITHSYSDDEQTIPRAYAKHVCNAIGMLGLRGITVVQTMAGAGPGTACLSNDGQNTPRFTPQFPASCPYVTSIGETNQTNPLMTWNISSGGFSDYFERPSWQDEAVSTYLNHHISPEVLRYYTPFFSATGRASPDLSLQGFLPDYQGDFTSTPIAPSGGTRGNAAWAALVGLLNDARFRAGLPAMGFMNPWLYKYGVRALTDITLGGSIGCVGSNIQRHQVIPGANVIPYVSWNATEGWDPATGLGFPDFQKLLGIAMDMKNRPDECPYEFHTFV